MRKYYLAEGVPHCPVSNPHVPFARIVGLKRDKLRSDGGKWLEPFQVVIESHVDLVKAYDKRQLKLAGPVVAKNAAEAAELLKGKRPELKPLPKSEQPKPKPAPKKGGDA